ncbi:MAG: GNAT family N-acetyltransferase [Hyphomicrobiaceae bacterium]
MGEVSAAEVQLTAPELLKPAHILDGFDCGEEVMNAWLQRRALGAAQDESARTYVVCRGGKVVGYYAIANGSLLHADAPGSLRRNAPNPIPALILARLAVDRSETGNGIGPGMLRDAMKRAVLVADISGMKTLLVHALDEKRAEYYEKYGFKRLSAGSLTLFMATRTIRAGF